ncbi:50S ribosomal protein L5 [Patescibacteria group bacterium]|nr:MAG: 50S ribosomal protein L5 [Patescibacteria group bacterium]
MSRLRDKYYNQVRPELAKQAEYTNPHQIPKIEKVVVNAGVGRAVSDSKQLELVGSTLIKVTGQAPVQTVAKNSIAGFKLRDGNKIGTMVTLRGERMYEFLDRVVAIVLPRIRDFRGISDTAFDGQGNYSIGLREQSVFPELTFEETQATHGLQINIITSAQTPAESKQLLTLMGFPFRRKN